MISKDSRVVNIYKKALKNEAHSGQLSMANALINQLLFKKDYYNIMMIFKYVLEKE